MRKNWKYLLILVCVIGSVSLVVSNFNFNIVSNADAKKASKSGLVYDLTSSTSSPEGAQVYGFVSDKKTNYPLVDATVKLKRSGKVVDSSSSASDGFYSMSTDKSGKYTVEVSKSKYKGSKHKINITSKEVKNNQKLVVNFDMKKRGK